MVYKSVLAQLMWNAAGLWPLVVLAALGVLAITFWLYPGQTRGLSRQWQVLLPAMRVMAVLALAISLLKPTFIRPRTEEEQGAIVVLVDRSASMGIADGRMSPAQRVALADGLGLLPAGKRPVAGSGVLKAITELRSGLETCTRSLADLEYARLSGRQEQDRRAEAEAVFSNAVRQAGELAGALEGVPAEGELGNQLKVLRETPEEKRWGAWVKEVAAGLMPLEGMLQKRQAEADGALYQADAEVKRAADAVAAMSRLRLAEEAIAGEKGLLAQLPADTPVYGYSFADGIRPLPLRSGGKAVKRLLVEAEGGQSRVGESVVQALEQLRGRPVKGVVVFSDGRAVGDVGMANAALVNTPVFGVQCGAAGAQRDLAIASVTMPPSAYAGEKVSVKVGVRGMGVGAGEHEVMLKVGDGADERPQVEKVKIGEGGTAEVEFAFEAGKAGVQEVEVAVKAAEEEATTQNNTVTRRLKVMQGKLAVMLLASEPSWDYQYVRNALSRTRWAKVTDVLVDDPKGRVRMAPEKILEQNVIVLHGLAAAALTSQQIDTLHRAVTGRGACVVLVAGDLPALDGYGRNVLLSELLPYRAGGRPAWRDWPGDRPAFRIAPARGAESLDVLRLGDSLQDSLARWNNLPAVYHYLALPQLKPNVVRALLVEKDSQLPVLLESRLGIGRVMFLGLRESWRWRMRVAERDQDRFWLQLVRYGGEEPYALVDDAAAMDVERVALRPGDATRVRVRVSGEGAEGGAVRAPVVELMREGKVVRVERPVAPPDAQPGRYETLLRDLEAGEYEVAVRPSGPSTRPAMKMPLHVGMGLDEELADISPDDGALRQLADGTGGQSMMLAGGADLPQKLGELHHRSGSTMEIPLWTSGYLFLFVLACLAMEWAIRKRAGLA